MPRLKSIEKAADIAAVNLVLEPSETPVAADGQVVVEIRSAGVNPSDVKATLGAFAYALWPRTPGRDWAGVVVDGPADLLGQEVWGSSGELGIRRDGTHGSHLVVERAHVRRKPSTVSLLEAGAVGVPFITAYEGLRRAGLPKSGDVVLVLGANGKVGQAAIQIATMLGAKVFGVERTLEAYARPRQRPGAHDRRGRGGPGQGRARRDATATAPTSSTTPSAAPISRRPTRPRR